MRKLKLFFALLMLIAFSVGNVWAVDYDLVYTLDGTLTNTGGNSNYAQAGNDVVQSDIHWSVTGNLTQNPWRIGGKNLVGVDREAYSKTAISDNIAKIEIEHGSKTLSAVNSMTVTIASNSDFSTVVSSFTPTFEANKTVTITRPDGKDWSNCYYKIVYNVDAGDSNSYLQLKSVKFYKEKSASDPVLESITITGDLDNKSYEEGQNIDFAGLTATGNYNDESTADLTDDVEWSFSPALTAGQTSVTVTATLDEISGNKLISGLTVAEHVVTPGTYDIPTQNDLWGTSYSGQAASITTLSGSKNDVSITINKNSGSTMYVTGSQTRIYSGYTMIFSVPNGYAITALQFTADGSNWAGDHTADVGTMTDNKNWSGEANTVTISVKGTCRMKAVKVTYAVAAPSKAEAGLEYAEADQKKLTKLGDAFTAPTLVNPNSLTVSYASNNTDVAEVAANGAVTIKAAGVAVITASFAGNDDYKAGSASYTIGVTAHAGTQADPYTVADAKIVIDAIETEENVHVAGKVSQIVTAFNSTYGNISFNISEDGTTANQLEAFRCKSFGGAAFTSENDVETGATVVVKGILKKYNSKYELDEGCCLVTYEAPEAPKTPIANTQETAYSVAQALIYAADGLTYDLNDEVFVQGKVAVASSSLFNNKYLTYFISDNGVNENTLKIYNGLDINGVSFTSKDDVKVGDIVIVKGKLLEYNSVLELNQNNELVLHKPVATISVENMEIAVDDEPKAIVAEIIPAVAAENAVYSIAEGGDAFISIDAENKISAIAEGVATVNVTLADGDTYAGTNASFTVTVNAAAPVLTDYYEKVTETAGIVEGTYLIVYEDGDNSLAFNGGLSTLDAESNTIAVTITNDNKIGVTTETAAATFYIDPAAGTVKSASDYYIGVSSWGNGLKQTDTYIHNVFEIDGDGNAQVGIYNANWNTTGGTMLLQYNKGAGQTRFRYFKNGGQQSIALYKLANETVKANPELAWSGDVEITLGDDFTAPTLDNPHSVEGITYSSDNEALATVNENGVISLEADATGTAHITASFAGDEDYKAASVSCTIIVNASAPTPQPTAEAKVIVVEYNSKFYAMSTTVKNGTGFEPIEVTKEDDKIIVKSDEEAAAIQWQIALGAEAATFQNGDAKYLACSDDSNTGLALLDAESEWAWDATASCYKQPGKDSKERTFYYNYNSGNPIFRAYTVAGIGAEGYSGAPEFIDADKIEVQVPTPKIDPELAFDPSEVELTLGEDFTAPTLNHVDGFNGTITYSSSKPAVATVDENTGVVTIVANGTTTITASFAGNDDYEEDEATYTITVNKPAPTPTSTIYRKVTATADITDGEYLIVYEGDATHDAAVFDGSLNNDNIDVAKKVLAVEIENDEIAGNTELDAAVFTIDVTAGSLQSASGLYIGKTDFSNGMDKSATEAYVNTFAITDGAAVITGVGGCTLRYNYAVDQLRFRYYKSGQQAIQLYKKESATPEPPVVNYTEVRTDLTEGWYYTMCLDKAVTAVQGGTIWRVLSKAANGNDVILEEAELPLVAGRPYIFRAAASTLEVAYTGDAVGAPVNDEDNHGLVGSFTEEPLAQNSNHYIIYNNALYYVNSNNVKVGAHRAYLDMTGVPAYSNEPQQGNAPRRRVTMTVYNEQTTTGIDELNASDTPVKMIIDGQLFIIRGEKMFNANGQLVK